MIFQFALIFPLLTFWFSFCLMLLIIQFLLLLRRTVRQSVSPKLFNLFVCLEYIEMFPSLGGRSRPALTLGQQQLLFGDHPTKSWTLWVILIYEERANMPANCSSSWSILLMFGMGFSSSAPPSFDALSPTYFSPTCAQTVCVKVTALGTWGPKRRQSPRTTKWARHSNRGAAICFLFIFFCFARTLTLTQLTPQLQHSVRNSKSRKDDTHFVGEMQETGETSVIRGLRAWLSNSI